MTPTAGYHRCTVPGWMNWMKRIPALVLLAVFAQAGNAALPESAVFSADLSTIDGETIRLDSFRGRKPVYLKFWASWCGTCLKEMPHLNSVHRDYGEEIAILAVNLGINDDRTTVLETREEFSLDMPVVIDRTGRLAQAFDLVATPFHVLLDRNLRVVHAEYSASGQLDEKLRRLAAGAGGHLEIVDTGSSEACAAGTNAATASRRDSSAGLEVLFFIATWCDWYLEETRPELSRNCTAAQRAVNRLYRQWPGLQWNGVASRMWTGSDELDGYRERYEVEHPLEIDSTNCIVLRHDIRQFPALLVLEDGREILRAGDFTDRGELARRFERAVSDRSGLSQ